MRCRCAPPTPRATAIGRSRGPVGPPPRAPRAPRPASRPRPRDHRDQPLLDRPGSTGGSAITGYKIEVSPNGISSWTNLVANTNSTATNYAHTGLASGDTRHYRVSAINTNGTGTASNVANATTGQTTVPPTLTSADVEETNGLSINLVFSEDLQLSNPPALSAFTVTVDGSAATVSSVGVPGSVLPQNELWLQLSTAIRQRQAVVVTYTDATSGDDTAAIQDTAGNDAATFTTGMDGVPAVTNNSTVTGLSPRTGASSPPAWHRRQVPAAVPLLHEAQRLVHRYRGPTTPSSRPAPRPATPTSGTTARTSGRSAAPPTPTPETTLKPPTPRPTRACPSTGSTAPRPPTSTRISTTGPGTTRPTTRTSPAPTARYLPERQLPLDRLRPRRHRGCHGQ